LLVAEARAGAARGAGASCYQPAFDSGPTCCVSSSDEVAFLDARSSACAHFGHGLLAASEYLRPPNGTVDLPHEAAFQEAAFKQGIFNTVTYRDCDTTWLGVTIRQPTQDIMIIQQLVYALRPQLFVELGSFRGGLAYFVATLFHLLGQEDGRVLSVDQVEKEYHEQRSCTSSGRRVGGRRERSSQRRPVGSLNQDRIWRQHVREVIAGSTSEKALMWVRRELRRLPSGASVVITLDSAHNYAHVWSEIQLYAPLVPVGSYLVVQDIILDFVKQPWQGPKAAVDRLLQARPEERALLGTWLWDKSVEVYGYTGHAYLRRVA